MRTAWMTAWALLTALFLAAYPERALRSMLVTPPTDDVRVNSKHSPRHDSTGSIARQPLLKFLAADPRHASRLADETLWRNWPAADRRLAGAQFHRLLVDGATVTGDAALADDAFALGFVEDVFDGSTDPLNDDPALRLAARVVAGVDERAELRGRIVDSDAGDDDVTFLYGSDIDAATFAKLLTVLAEDADPRASMVAARLLASTGRRDALDAVFAADAWLACGAVYSSATWSDDVAHLARSAEHRDAVLRHVAKPGGLPYQRVSAFEALVSLEWLSWGSWEAGEDAAAVRREREIDALSAWLQSVFATLDADVAEGVFDAWLEQWGALPGDVDSPTRTPLRVALESFPDGSVKRRMQAQLAAYDDAD